MIRATVEDVFDARSLPNPGREERFKQLTGVDAAVIDYLNQQESVQQLYCPHGVDRGFKRGCVSASGLRNLMVSFGCTGGQHRSVFLAEQLARHLRQPAESRSCYATWNWKRNSRRR